MGKIQLNYNKTLKLTNVLRRKMEMNDGERVMDAQLEQMQSYSKIKGAKQIGPLVQYTDSYINESGEIDMDIRIMLQCSTYIHNIEQPYSMEAVIRVPNCIYCR